MKNLYQNLKRNIPDTSKHLRRQKMKIAKLIKEHGEKICSVCGKPYPNTADYFYRTGGRLRPDCIKCQDRKQKNKTISELKSGVDYKKIVAQNKEIQDLKRTVGLQSENIRKHVNIMNFSEIEKKSLKESIKENEKWNKVLFTCLVIYILGSWLIILT